MYPISKPMQFNMSSMLPLGYQIAAVRWKPCSYKNYNNDLRNKMRTFTVLWEIWAIILEIRWDLTDKKVWKNTKIIIKISEWFQSENIFGLIFTHNKLNIVFHSLVSDVTLKDKTISTVMSNKKEKCYFGVTRFSCDNNVSLAAALLGTQNIVRIYT